MAKCRKKVALVFPPVPSYSHKLTMGVVERHLAHNDWSIIEVPREIPGQSPFAGDGTLPDGVIVWAESVDQWLHELLDRKIPVVNCGTEWLGVEGVASAHFDYDDIHRHLLRHFMDLGLRRVIAIGHRLPDRPQTLTSLETFVNLASDSGMESYVWELDGVDSPAILPRRLLATERESKLADFLTSLRKPAGIYCYGDHIGYIVSAVASSLGIKVPQQLAIAGFGDNLIATFADPPLTTIDGAAHQVGLAAADCLAHWMKHGQPPFTDLAVAGFELIERESTVGKSGSVVLEAVRRYIDMHAGHGTSLDELVSLSGLSVKTLVRQYRESFGHDPMEDIHQRRLKEAKMLLNKSTLAIGAIATSCGFSSQAAFANYFLRHTGCSPGAYRKEHTTDSF